MSPHRRLSINSQRHPSQIQDIFLGLAFQLHPARDPARPNDRDLEYTAVLNDATGVIESETFHLDFHVHDDAEPELQADEVRRLLGPLMELTRTIQVDKGMNIRLIAIAEPVPQELRPQKRVEFFATVWLHIDAIPFICTPATSIFTKLPAPSTQASASSAVAAAVRHLHPASHSATMAAIDGATHEVQVDCNGQVRLCSIAQYQESTSRELWSRFIALAKHLRKNDVSISYFSATPQGGGVALMRHAMIRLWRMVGLKVKWFVPEGHPSVFDTTKRKIHNVLQGVAPEGTEMSDEDKRWFEIWTEQNYETFWSRGALDASVIVIDDPQLTGLIPIIRKTRPDGKIIFRSHIQIQSDLTDDPNTAQHRTWNYLYDFVKQADLFLAHPVKFFVPKNVHDNMAVLYMAPSTDPLDGLNKPYGQASVDYFRQQFNSLSAKQCGVTIDWDRGYICQIARFDPSKGIDILVEAYLKFRQKLDANPSPPVDGGPQLILMGHGSVDDPDGTVICEQVHEILASEGYELVKHDVAVVRAPPSDSILGCILQGAWVATQLSTREGFEVKVTEAINKRVPIIASSAGGIPLQVRHGKNGWVVPAGESEPVAQLLFDIFMGQAEVSRPIGTYKELEGKADPNSVAESFAKDFARPYAKVHGDENATSEDFWTVGNATRWMLLASRLLGLQPEASGDNRHGNGGQPNGMEVKGDVSLTEEEMGLLVSMEIGKKLGGRAVDGINVWKMVMGKDTLPGEGELREGRA